MRSPTTLKTEVAGFDGTRRGSVRQGDLERVVARDGHGPGSEVGQIVPRGRARSWPGGVDGVQVVGLALSSRAAAGADRRLGIQPGPSTHRGVASVSGSRSGAHNRGVVGRPVPAPAGLATDRRCAVGRARRGVQGGEPVPRRRVIRQHGPAILRAETHSHRSGSSAHARKGLPVASTGVADSQMARSCPCRSPGSWQARAQEIRRVHPGQEWCGHGKEGAARPRRCPSTPTIRGRR